MARLESSSKKKGLVLFDRRISRTSQAVDLP